jgi:glycosyltransferase involved in cell wall biosynthesis
MGWRVDRWVRRRAFPDAYAAWARASVRPLVSLVESESVEAVYTTFSPASNHLLGLTLKRRMGLPWIADFRDLWTDDYRYCESSRARRDADRRLEQEILETADAVIGVTESQTRILADHVPSARHKFLTITNGFDPEDFNRDEPARSGAGDIFVLAYVGRLDRLRASDAWLGGLQRFTSGLGTDRRRFKLRLVGHASPETCRRIRATGVKCDVSGYVLHEEAVQEMRAADALLLSVPDGTNADSTIPAKLFEYLASSRPILAVGPAGGAWEPIVRTAQAGLNVGLDEMAVCGALQRLFENWRGGHPGPVCQPDSLVPFSRVELTRRLASILDDLSTGRDAVPPEVEVSSAACLS